MNEELHSGNAAFILNLMEREFKTVDVRLNDINEKITEDRIELTKKLDELKLSGDRRGQMMLDRMDKFMEQHTKSLERINSLENWKENKVEPELQELTSIKEFKWKTVGVIGFVVFIAPVIYHLVGIIFSK